MRNGLSGDTLEPVNRTARLADVVVILFLFVWTQVQIWSTPADWPTGPLVQAVLATIITLPLLVRRRRPLAVMLAVLAASWLSFELGPGLGQPWFAMLLAVYGVASHAPMTVALIGAGATLAVIIAFDIPRLLAGEDMGEIVPAWFITAGVWGLGRWMRHRRQQVADLEKRTDSLERNQEEAQQQAAAEERARIARELHDLVAHAMSIIVIQAQAARSVLHTDATSADRALASIETSGRLGLAELRRLLGMLRTDTGLPSGPQPGLRDLQRLVDEAEMAGLRLTVTIEGHPDGLSPGLDLTIYRIIQESLTNVRKHAPATKAQLTIRRSTTSIEIEITDNGTGSIHTGDPGHGLVGIRERVSLYGGDCTTGSVAGGGYRVWASLPLEPTPGAT
jgi:signal transduction histidine kinase